MKTRDNILGLVTTHLESVEDSGVKDKLLSLCSIVSDRIEGLGQMKLELPGGLLRSLVQQTNEQLADVIEPLDNLLAEVETKAAALIQRLQSEDGYLFTQGFIDDMCEVMQLMNEPLKDLGRKIDQKLDGEAFGELVKGRRKSISKRSEVERGDRAFEVFVGSEYSRMQFERLQEAGALLKDLEKEIMFYYKEALYFLWSGVAAQCLRVLSALPVDGEPEYDQNHNLLRVMKRLRILIAGIRGLKRTRALLNA